MPRTRSVQSYLRPTTSAVDFSWQERWCVYIRCTPEITETSFPGNKPKNILSKSLVLKLDFVPIKAHDNAIKCLAIDPHEEHFVTGSADGDIRVTYIINHSTIYDFRFYAKIFWLKIKFIRVGMGSNGAHIVIFVPWRARQKQFLQAHRSGCHSTASRCKWTPFLMRSWWLNESQAVTWPRIYSPFVVLMCKVGSINYSKK